MFISRECDYAIRIIRALSDYEIKPVNEICTSENVPVQYAYKILKKLEKASLVMSHRGVHGGYELCKKTNDIFLYDIIFAVENQFLINECMVEGYECPKNMKGQICKVHTELVRVQNKLAESLKEKSLFEILNTSG